MSPETFQALLEKYLQDELSADELPAFLTAAREKRHQAIIKEMLAGKLEYAPMHKVSGTEKLESMFGRMLAKVEEQEYNTPVLVSRRLNRWWYAAAAVLLVLGGYGIYAYRTGQDKTNTLAADKHIHNTTPGRDGAILTLADGKTIVLDSMHNGVVTTQNGATVLMQNGRLAYRVNQPGHTTATYNTVRTPRGRQFQLVLADGTKIWLNAASSITFPTSFDGKDRRVELSGEAYLEVAHNPRQPFKVMARGAEVRVLGTVFNISAYEDENTIRTTLLEGSIKLTYSHSGGKKEMLLKPGEQVNIDRTMDADPIKKENDHLDATVAWKNGLFIMKGIDVSMIMKQVARWYNIKVVFEGPVPEGRISGELPRNMDLQKLLEVIEASGIAISFKWEGDQLVVTNNKNLPR